MPDPLKTLRLLMSPIYAGALAADHWADLEKSMTAETIRAHGFRSVPPSMIRPLLGWDSPRICSAYILPYPDPLGVMLERAGRPAWPWMDHVVLRLFPPFKPRDKNGQETRGTIKYGQPKGTPPRLFFPLQGLAEVIGSSDQPLWLIEGAKKSLAAAQLGFAAVGFAGVQAWHAKGSRELLPDCELIPLGSRVVEIVPDSDVQSNRDAARGIELLGHALAERGARPRIVLLPAAPPALAAAL
jgi:Domain of unknown function (DUF3854)